MFIISGYEIFNSYVTDRIENLETLLNDLRNYVNNELDKIYKIYNNNVLYIKENWRLSTFDSIKKEINK